MRYALIREMDVSNGLGIGVSIFVQGCPIHCPGCFNSDIWDFDGGHDFDEELMDELYESINKPYISRLSVLGGEPLASRNIDDVATLISWVKTTFPDKKIWLYTGYELAYENFFEHYFDLLNMCDYVVDGRYIQEQRDVSLAFRGSRNQRVIDVKATLRNKGIITLEV